MDDDELKEFIEDDPDITMPIDPEREVREYLMEEPKNWDMINGVILKAPDWLRKSMMKVLAEKSSSVDLRPAVPALISALKGGLEVKELAAKLLGKMGVNEEQLKEIIQMLKEGNGWKERYGPALALGEIAKNHPEYNRKEAVSALSDALRDENWDVRYRASEVLKLLGDNMIDKCDYPAALTIIKELTLYVRKEYEVKKDRDSLKKRREKLAPLESLTQKIHDKMNSVDNDKKFPVKHQPVRTVRRKVRANG